MRQVMSVMAKLYNCYYCIYYSALSFILISVLWAGVGPDPLDPPPAHAPGRFILLNTCLLNRVFWASSLKMRHHFHCERTQSTQSQQAVIFLESKLTVSYWNITSSVPDADHFGEWPKYNHAWYLIDCNQCDSNL